MTGVYLEQDGNQLVMVGTDGKRLSLLGESLKSSFPSLSQ